MKKTVFLFIIVIFLSFNTNLSASSEPLVFGFKDYEIRLNTISHPIRGRGYRVQKIGANAFTEDKVFLNQKTYITNCVEINDLHVFYGYTHNYEGENYYDPFVMILDKEGNEKFVLFEDFGDLEEVVQVVEIDNILLIQIEQSVEDELRDIVFDNNLFITYDFEYNRLNTTSVDTEITRNAYTDQLFLFDFDYEDGYSGGLNAELEIIVDDILEISNNHIFEESATILFINEALLNGKEYLHGVTIDYPGNYELEYNDFVYRFSVSSVVSGVTDNEVYLEGISPRIETGKAYLNNDLYVSETPITEPGNYVLKIIGVNGYEETYDFTINPNVTGVLNDKVYDDDVQIEFDGIGYLNNTYIESPYTVTEEGEYLLKIKGEGNYLETYHFTVDTPEEEPTLIDYVKKYDVVFLGVVVVVGGIILKKK